MNANQRPWMLAVTLAFIVSASLRVAGAAEPAYELTDAINQLTAKEIPSSFPINDAIVEFALPDSVPPPPPVASKCGGDDTVRPQHCLEYWLKKFEQQPTLLPIERHVEHFGMPEAPFFGGYCRGPSANPEVFYAALQYHKRREREVRATFYALFPFLPRLTESTDLPLLEPSDESVGPYESLQLAGIGDCMLNPAERPAPTPIMTQLASTILSTEVDGLSDHDDPLIATVPEVKTFFRVAPGLQRIVVPARGPAPIPLDFAFPPVFDQGIIRQFDAPTRQAPIRSTEPPMWKWTLAMNS